MSDTSIESGDLGALLGRYETPFEHFDELLDRDGRLRPSWQPFASLAALSAPGLTAAESRVAHQIHGNGVTYNVYAASGGPTRPWALDVLPFVIAAAEWDGLSHGLRQRARLMNAIATDLYSDQRLLQDGIVPPAVVFRHAGFLRLSQGVRPPGGVFVHFVAFDLVRGPDGAWRVIATRAQAPSGAGYALENRAIISRLFPETFRRLQAQRLGPFFEALEHALLSMAPSDGEPPLAVLLTPGPYAETYFEHAFLAKHLNFQLVQGADLTVRHDRLFLKTVSGLRRVHAVLRRLDEGYADPLELRPDSTLGVPGLVQAWRSGNVLMANAFGTGVLESPALRGFLPAACQHLFGQPLDIGTLDSAWCGSPFQRSGVADRLRNGVVKPAFPENRMEPVFLGTLDAAARSDWEQRLETAGENFVVEEYLPLSHVPAWHGGALESRALMLRVFLVTDGAGDYRLMPGGLSRIAGAEREIVSGQRGGSSKDTWVVGDLAPEPPAPSVVRVQPSQQTRAEDEAPAVSSRAAENLFWLGRYAERSENCARLVRAILTRLVQADAVSSRLEDLFAGTGRRQGMLALPDDSRPVDLLELVLHGLFDRETQSLYFNVDRTIRAASQVRDRLSSDNWKVLSRLSDLFVFPQAVGIETPFRIDPDEALDLIDRTIVSLVAVGGLEMAHMTRDDGWRFLTLGRHLERLWFVTSTLEDVAAEHAVDDPSALEWLLELSDSLITYRTRHVRQPEWQPVVDLLLFDARNPRSAAFQLTKLVKHVRLLPGGDLTAAVSDIERLIETCQGVRDRSQGELFAAARTMEGLIGDCRRLALSVADQLSLRYFSHVYERPHSTVLP